MPFAGITGIGSHCGFLKGQNNPCTLIEAEKNSLSTNYGDDWKVVDFSKLYSVFTGAYEKLSSSLPRGYALPPNHVYLLLSDRCNLRCSMCTWVKGRSRAVSTGDELSHGQIRTIFSALPRHALVTISGGEPLVRKDIFDTLSAGSKKFKIHLITNGTLLSGKASGVIAELSMKNIYSKGILMVGVSLHGDRQVEDDISGMAGTYEKIVEGILSMKEARARVGRRYPLIHITTVITPENHHMLSDMYRFASELGVDYQNFTLQSNSEKVHSFAGMDGTGLYEEPAPHQSFDLSVLKRELGKIECLSLTSGVVVRFSPLGVNQDEIIRYYENRLELSDYSCSGLWSKMVISPYGDIYMCYRKLGNINDGSVISIWNSAEYRKLRMEIGSSQLRAGCAGCCFRSFDDRDRGEKS